jgi:hypothetical protein
VRAHEAFGVGSYRLLAFLIFYVYISDMEKVAPQPTYDELLAEVTRLRAELAQLRRLFVGQKREGFVPVNNASQLDIDLGQPPSPRRRSKPCV